MRLFVLGKLGSVVHWVEDSIVGFRAAGHDVRFGITRDPRLSRSIENLLHVRWTGAPRVAHICRAITHFSPDLILAIGPYGMPLPILEHVAGLRGRPPLLGWVGDLFTAASRRAAELLDAVAYTDTGMLAQHQELGLQSRAVYLPHAANPRLDRGVPNSGARGRHMVFVANPTPHRRALVSQVRTPMQLYGPGWTRVKQTDHEIHPRLVGIEELATIYRAHLAVLNVRNEDNVLAGLNQRHFDPYLAATPVVADDQADLARCFEPGREVLVYRDPDELNEIYHRLQREPGRAAAIGEAGRRRVLAEHTYPHRLAALTKLAA
jgi:spore maturation protein CgeB